jgi:two-component system sensor histidine kinase DesK
VFPIADIVSTDRPAVARVLAAVGLAAFTLAYLLVIAHLGLSSAIGKTGARTRVEAARVAQ